MIYLDTETCGLHGMPVLLQYAEDDGPVVLYRIWQEPIHKTLRLIEWIVSQEVCGFNLAFDWFMLIKAYTTFRLYHDHDAHPEDIVNELGVLEEKARFQNICLKPKAACDIMLHARRGPTQALMDRDDIKIRRVPTALAYHLAEELEKRIVFDEIYFARRKDKYAPKWKVFDIEREDGTIHPDFKDIKLRFSPSGALKNLYRHVFKIKERVILFREVEVASKFRPEEKGYAPFALALVPYYHIDKRWRNTWPDMIQQHILHWGYNEEAREYAGNDVVYTRRLHKEYFQSVPAGDVDSNLACAVAACRWRGYAVNEPRIKELKAEAKSKIGATPVAPRLAKKYLLGAMDEIERVAFAGSTKRVVLEELAKWTDDEGKRHPAAMRAQEILDARMAIKEVELYDKLLLARRLHASFKVIGTLSSRMAGADGLNPQGIKHSKEVRGAFPLADRDSSLLSDYVPDPVALVMTLCGGDFKSFEVSLAAKVFDDPQLNAALMSGVKVHGIMGMELNPGMTYEEVLASEGCKDTTQDWYDKGKKGFFLKCYFGEAYTFNKKLGIPMEVAEAADANFNRKFPKVKQFQDKVRWDFGCLAQPGGIGSKIEWKEPKEFAESFLGFRRYFTLENRVIRALYDLAQKPPPLLKNAQIKVVRRDRIQTAGGAVQSALYAAAFTLMSSAIRAAGNHYIQSPGAEITKATQHGVWTLQPCGIHEWIVQPMNVHDEIMCPTKPGHEMIVEQKAKEVVAEYRKLVPLLAIDWMTNISSWAAKKGEPIVAANQAQGELVQQGA